MKFQDQSFIERHTTSELISYKLMNFLYENKHIKGFKKTDVETDKTGIDYFVNFDEGYLPVQFKLRGQNYKDIPVCRYQPFRGINNCTLGRDYKSLTAQKNKFYIVALQSLSQNTFEIHICSTEKLLNTILQAEKEWFQQHEAWNDFPSFEYDYMIQERIFSKKLRSASNGTEAWFKKNRNENFGKINYYVPMNFSEKTILISTG